MGDSNYDVWGILFGCLLFAALFPAMAQGINEDMLIAPEGYTMAEYQEWRQENPETAAASDRELMGVAWGFSATLLAGAGCCLYVLWGERTRPRRHWLVLRVEKPPLRLKDRNN